MSQRNGLFKELIKNRALFILMLPGLLYLFINNYIPMVGAVIAFQRVHYGKNIFETYFKSPFVGFKNFEFFLNTDYAWIITRNTVLYNLVFIFGGLFLAVTVAIALNEIMFKRLAKAYQSFIILPNFLSWVVISGIVYALLTSNGFINSILVDVFGKEPISFYSEQKYWPFIIIYVRNIYAVGVDSIIFLAAISGINGEYYESAMIEGASKWNQIKNITLPLLKPTVVTLLLIWLGSIFSANFGLFYNVPRESGILFNVTNVLDTYVFRSLRVNGQIEMASAASLYQSVVGFVIVLAANALTRKVDSENSLF